MNHAQKFSFDTEFDDAGEVTYVAPTRTKRIYQAEEVEHMLAAARAEGERAGLASAAADQARALAMIGEACRQALPKLAEVAHEHRVGAAQLALACGRAIADAALDQFPQAPVSAALETLSREVEAASRLIVTAPPGMAGGLGEALEGLARNMGFDGQIQIRTDAGLGPHAFTLDFGDGQAAFDPAAASERVAQALAAAVAAEGLHAEPLIPGAES